MKTGGWIFLILSWGLLLWLNGFCFYKILRHHGLEDDD